MTQKRKYKIEFGAPPENGHKITVTLNGEVRSFVFWGHRSYEFDGATKNLMLWRDADGELWLSGLKANSMYPCDGARADWILGNDMSEFPPGSRAARYASGLSVRKRVLTANGSAECDELWEKFMGGHFDGMKCVSFSSTTTNGVMTARLTLEGGLNATKI